MESQFKFFRQKQSVGVGVLSSVAFRQRMELASKGDWELVWSNTVRCGRSAPPDDPKLERSVLNAGRRWQTAESGAKLGVTFANARLDVAPRPRGTVDADFLGLSAPFLALLAGGDKVKERLKRNVTAKFVTYPVASLPAECLPFGAAELTGWRCRCDLNIHWPQ